VNAPVSFHPAVTAWLAGCEPTGSGKTFAAFLAAIDQLVKEAMTGPLPDETRIVYVSPLKALSNDIQRNLQTPLRGIREELARMDLPDADIRAVVRSGDTSQAERAAMRRRPPHIVVTTPESLYILLGSQSGRDMLATCRTVIVDEIHAVAGNKRGAHLAISLERLQALTGRLTRVGLSATQRPIDEVARFLAPAAPCTIVDSGHTRARDLELELPAAPLEAVITGEAWTEIYDRLALLAAEHRTTLVFVNTRRLVERIARHLSERLGESNVGAHHGSLSKERRLRAEQRLKNGELKLLVATASLELGIDIGDVDLVCQIGSTRSINAFLQRVGRAGHAVGGTSKGRLFPLSRDELVECAALLDAVRRGELDRLHIPENALDVLSQHMVAEVAAREWPEDGLYALMRRAHPYRNLRREDFDQCVRMLAEGFSTRRGRRAALLHHDAVNRVLRARKGARLTAITSGGAIPDNADYRVLLEPQALVVGSVHEDFAVESLQGDVFQLGNASYRILRVERGTVRVEDAQGQPPSIPFWLGEAPGRSAELSAAVSGFRAKFAELSVGGLEQVMSWLRGAMRLSESAAHQIHQYLGAGLAALGCLPTHDTVVFERFFDESGGMQLVIHSPFGSRLNRAWGLALRKRFCRTFNVELQAAATEDHIVLSLTHAHSFELADAARYLNSATVRQILVQAVCAAPMFAVRWRWTAGIALALPRFRGGRRVAPQIARMNAEDLSASVFPDQIACAENLPGEIEIPDHPLVRQSIRDCLEEAMDIDSFERLLGRLERGAVRVVARDLTEASPLALEALTVRPYAFLDDAPLEERRTQAVISRRWLDPADAADIGRLDPGAIARVRAEAWPDATTADELHDALLWLTFVTDAERLRNPAWPPLMEQLLSHGRVAALRTALGTWWVATERLHLFPPSEASLVTLVRGRLEGLGPVRVADLAAAVAQPENAIEIALAALQAEGFALRGRFTGPGTEEWCERRLLARIHRYTVKRLRAEIEPVNAREFLRFLCQWQCVQPDARRRGSDALAAVLSQLEGFEAPAGAWESELLCSRIADYEPQWLDEHCRSGRFIWMRLAPRSPLTGDDARPGARFAAPIKSTPLVLLARRSLGAFIPRAAAEGAPLSSRARAVADFIRDHGASFFDEIAESLGLLPAEAEDALRELVALGLANSDSFAGLRVLLMPAAARGRGAASGPRLRARRRPALFGMADAGRWAQVRRPPPSPAERRDIEVEQVVHALLRRWGVIFWKLLAREAHWLPPWREVLSCCRRLEARGELRGGRFVEGFSGEQFATPEAVGALREMRRKPHGGQFVAVSAADPLNLLGIITPGARLPSLAGNRVLYRDGLPVAFYAGGEVTFLGSHEPAARWEMQRALQTRLPLVADDPAEAPPLDSPAI
jgi:ATP-dependent Lhr-like helicase